MATLTIDEITRSTRIDPASRPRLSMPLSAARDALIVSGRRLALTGQVPGTKYALSASYGPSDDLQQHGSPAALINDNNSINPSTTDIAARLGTRKSCGDVNDEGVKAIKFYGMGAFVLRLGSRPPSPPV